MLQNNNLLNRSELSIPTFEHSNVKSNIKHENLFFNKGVTAIKIILNAIFKIFPINNKYVYFRSYTGQYSDNPKYISEMLHSIDNEFLFIWEINEHSNRNMIPEYIKQVKPNSFQALYYKSRSLVIVENSLGYTYKYLKTREFKIWHIIMNLIRTKNQFNISTWHGTPLKKIAMDIPDHKEYSDFISTSNVIITGCKHTSDVLKRITLGKIPVLSTGSPRNDILFKLNDYDLKFNIKLKLHLPSNKKILLFAPTFRKNLIESGITSLKNLNFIELFKVLNQKFGGEWIFVYRFHDSVSKNINWQVPISMSNDIINGNEFDDMAEYLFVSDLLITDYSSSMFDFSLTANPCFLYCPDLDDYKNFERGFYFDLNKLPYSIAKTFNELIDNIIKFNHSNYIKETNNFLNSIGNIEDGNASVKVANMINTLTKKLH